MRWPLVAIVILGEGVAHAQVVERPPDLLAAAEVSARSEVDTGGALGAGARVGLGGVADFGVATTVGSYTLASFRMGYRGVVLGFRKSFERTDGALASRIAELSLFAHHHLGPDLTIHAGLSFWDALLRGPGFEEILHEQGLGAQLRAAGGIELRTFERSTAFVDLGWAPDLCEARPRAASSSGCAMRLRPELAWGVGYDVTPHARLVTGVRIPDLADARLRDVRIFGELTIRGSAPWRSRRPHAGVVASSRRVGGR